MFLDPGELTRLVGAGGIETLLAYDPRARLARDEGVPCCACGALMETRAVGDGSREVLVDLCAHCHGVWLDPRELGDLRALDPGPLADRVRAARTLAIQETMQDRSFVVGVFLAIVLLAGFGAVGGGRFGRGRSGGGGASGKL
jgi:Zn-finger nucleic acid-binding protein